MRKHLRYIILLLVIVFAMTILLGCGLGKVKTPKYPGKEAPVGTKQTPSPETPKAPGDTSPGSGSSMLTPQDQPDSSGQAGGTSVPIPVPPAGSTPVGKRIAEPVQQEASGDDKEAAKDESSTAKDDSAKEESKDDSAKDEESDVPYHDQTPTKYTRDLGEFAFFFNNADQGVGELNQLLEAIDLLKVNEQKYEHAKDFLTAEAEGMSRGDPLFIPDQVPEELRPLIPGEGISGAMDEELENLFYAQVEANLRIIPINIIGVMEQGGARTAIGYIGGNKFTISQGQIVYMRYSGWYFLGMTGTLVTEDLVILSLGLYQYNGYSMTLRTDLVPRSFHIGIT